MRRLLTILLAAVMLAGCGSPMTWQRAARAQLTAQKLVVDLAWLAIQATADSEEIPAEEMAAAANAYAAFTMGYPAAVAAVEAGDQAAYAAAVAQLAQPTITILRIKAAYCPFRDKGED